MALTKGTNSYVTVDEADSYFEDRLDVAAWTEASDDQKRQSLITATQMLDDLEWTGVAASDSQPLAFPRTGSYFDPRLGLDVTMDGVPDKIERACKEWAYHLLNNDGLLDSTGGVSEIKVGPIELKGIRSSSDKPGPVMKAIRPLLLNKGASSWWRAN